MENISKDKSIYIILNTPITSKSMSGGDKIYIKISEIISNKHGYKVYFLGCPDGINLVKSSTNSKFEYIPINNISGEGKNVFLTYILRLLFLYKVIFIKLKPNSIVVSASDFITDTFPLFLLKLTNKKTQKYFSSMFLKKEVSSKSDIKDYIYFVSQYLSMSISKFLKIRIFTNLVDIDYILSFGFDRKDIFVLPGGVESMENLDKNSKIIYDSCFIGRISHQKGLDTLLEILTEVIKVKPEFKLALITSGTFEEKESLKKLILEKNLNNNIDNLGFLDNLEKFKILRSSKMLLFPSRFESFGIVVAEALNLGVPVVSFDLEALRLNFKEGVLFSKDNNEFIKNILSILENNQLAIDLGSRGREYVSKYDWEKISKNFLDNLV